MATTAKVTTKMTAAEKAEKVRIADEKKRIVAMLDGLGEAFNHWTVQRRKDGDKKPYYVVSVARALPVPEGSFRHLMENHGYVTPTIMELNMIQERYAALGLDVPLKLVTNY